MKKIMIVDDEVIVRIGIRSIVNWEEHGYTVSADASSGEEALEKILRCRPDIILTDLVMQNMDGFE
jgi:two-component system response regulator YesN